MTTLFPSLTYTALMIIFCTPVTTAKHREVRSLWQISPCGAVNILITFLETGLCLPITMQSVKLHCSDFGLLQIHSITQIQRTNIGFC